MKLNNIRNKIDKTDKKIAKLLNKRFHLVQEVKEIKKDEALVIEDISREQEILAQNSVFIEPVFKDQFNAIYKTIFEASKNFQKQ